MENKQSNPAIASLDRRRFLKSALATAAAGGVVIMLPGCGSDLNPVSFATVSDPHLYDIDTLGSNADLDAYLANDRKMLKQSVQTFNAALADIKSWNVDFLLISGDLTKDGELVNHQLMADTLNAFGKPAYVIPGNHDINNPAAMSYDGTTTAIANIAPADFRTIYANFGYSQALYTDSNSLSYVAEPAEGVWLLAIDSCKYSDNATLGYPVTSGAIGADTLSWITDKLSIANAKGKIVIAMMHHGLIEHFSGQATLFPDYLVDNRASVAATLSAAGLRAVFTGHFHANDAVLAAYSGNTIYDLETGSTVTAPCPYRHVQINRALPSLTVSTSHVTAIPDYPTTFVTYENDYLETGLETLVTAMLTASPYSLPTATVSALLPLIVPAMMAHYAGDEKLTDATVQAEINAMAASTDANTAMIGQILLGLWNDPAPADNNLSVPMAG